MTGRATAAPYRDGYGQQYRTWHFADQRINFRHDPTLEPTSCEDGPSVNPWRAKSDDARRTANVLDAISYSLVYAGFVCDLCDGSLTSQPGATLREIIALGKRHLSVCVSAASVGVEGDA